MPFFAARLYKNFHILQIWYKNTMFCRTVEMLLFNGNWTVTSASAIDGVLATFVLMYKNTAMPIQADSCRMLTLIGWPNKPERPYSEPPVWLKKLIGGSWFWWFKNFDFLNKNGNIAYVGIWTRYLSIVKKPKSLCLVMIHQLWEPSMWMVATFIKEFDQIQSWMVKYKLTLNRNKSY